MNTPLFQLGPSAQLSEPPIVDDKPDYGPSVVDGFVRRTSVSALTSFDPQSYAGCPRRWWWQRVAGKKEQETTAQGIGKQIHKQIENYLKTGVDTLGPVARAGKHLLPQPGDDLHVEANFGNFGMAIAMRDSMRSDPPDHVEEEMVKAAGLVAGQIPLDGYIDVRHSRGEWIDNGGILHREDPQLGVVHCVSDHKSTSSIEDFGKSPGELVETIQMVGYGKYVLNVEPGVDHVRVEHNYFQTRGQKIAKKVTAILSRRGIEDRWRRVDQLAVYMEEVARATRFEDVEAQPKSCTAYKGCPHRPYCPVKLNFNAHTIGGSEMSLFGNVIKQQTTNGTTNGATNGTTQPAQQPTGSLFGSVKPAEDRTAVEAAKSRFAAEDAPAVAYGFCNKCGTALSNANASKSPSGEIRHIGCKVVAPGQIVPSDAAQPTPANSAVPPPPAAMAEVTDPEIRARAAEISTAQAEAPTEKKGGRCPSGGQELKVTPKEARDRKAKCPGCGVDLKLKDEDFNTTCDAVTIRKHNLPKVETPAPQPAPVQTQAVSSSLFSGTAQQPTQQVQQVPQPQQVQQEQPTPPVTQQGIVILIDAINPRQKLLEDYWRPMVAELEKQAGGCDLRCAPSDTPVGYSKWKGLLATWVKERPPAPGIYFARGTNEFDQVVVDALIGIIGSDNVTRGVR